MHFNIKGRVDKWGEKGLFSMYLTPVVCILTLAGFVGILEIGCHGISDLTPLTTLRHLDHIRITSGELSDLTPLSSMKHLIALELSENRIQDLSSPAELPALFKLTLDENRIEDVSPLTALAKLKNLSLKKKQDHGRLSVGRRGGSRNARPELQQGSGCRPSTEPGSQGLPHFQKQ